MTVVLYTNCVSNSHALRQAWIILGTEESPRIPAETVLSFVKIGKLKVLLHLSDSFLCFSSILIKFGANSIHKNLPNGSDFLKKSAQL